MNIDIGRSVTYPFEDPRWTTKVGILLLIGFVPGLNVIVWSGYTLSIARNMYRRVPMPLPDWSEWSDIAVRGLLTIVATIIYFLPVILLSACIGFGGLLFGGHDNGVFTAIQCCSTLLIVMYSIAAMLVLTTGHVRYAQTDQFNTYLDVGSRIRDLQANLNAFLTLFVLQALVMALTIALTAILFVTCIGVSAVPTLGSLISGFLLGSVTVSLGNHR